MVVHWSKAGDKFKFEAEANFAGEEDPSVENKWIGVGLSLDGGRAMGNDAAVACFIGSDGNANVVNYWNVLDPSFFSFPVEVIPTSHVLKSHGTVYE